MKDKLPDIGNPYGGDHDAFIPGGGTEEADKYNGGVRDSVEFILLNFTEMNRLWVRMQQDCKTPRDIPRCENERLELRLLVGANISTLARLAGVDLAVYKSLVLPAVLDQIVSCHDAIAQEYFADCVAQVFPDDFQLATLDEIMAMCSQLVRRVNLKTILVSVLDRLTRYAGLSEANAADDRSANAFRIFRNHLPTLLSTQKTSLSVADRICMFMSLMRLTLKAEPASLVQVDDVLGFAVQAAREGFAVILNQRVGTTSGALVGDSDALPSLQEEEEELLVGLLTLPLDVHPSVSTSRKREGERVLLLFDVAHRLVRLHELGCTTAAGSSRLDEVLRLLREILDERRAKNSIVGRAASTRLYRLQKFIKSNPNEYSPLALKHL
jgi:hypothetical protein